MVSCAVGIALDEGLIHLDEKIVDIFPEYAPEKAEGYLGDVTLENMLTMTYRSGKLANFSVTGRNVIQRRTGSDISLKMRRL